DPPLRTFATGDGADQLRLKLRLVQVRAVLAVRDVTDRFSAATEFDAQLRKRMCAVNHRIGARIDVDGLAVHGVTAARTVSLLIALDVSRALQIPDKIVFRNRLVDANLLGRGVDARRTREHITT